MDYFFALIFAAIKSGWKVFLATALRSAIIAFVFLAVFNFLTPVVGTIGSFVTCVMFGASYFVLGKVRK